MPPPAPARRAEQIEPEAPPATLAEPEMARARHRSQDEDGRRGELPVEPGNADGGFGAQLPQDAMTAVVGSDNLQWADLGDGLSAVMDASPEEDMAWKFGDDGEEMAGRAIVGGYDSETDTWIDAPHHRRGARGDPLGWRC
jgi:hypothetical protein